MAVHLIICFPIAYPFLFASQLLIQGLPNKFQLQFGLRFTWAVFGLVFFCPLLEYLWPPDDGSVDLSKPTASRIGSFRRRTSAFGRTGRMWKDIPCGTSRFLGWKNKMSTASKTAAWRADGQQSKYL